MSAEVNAVAVGLVIAFAGMVVAMLLVMAVRAARAPRRHKKTVRPFRCPHPGDPLCARFGCPEDPQWPGDRA